MITKRQKASGSGSRPILIWPGKEGWVFCKDGKTDLYPEFPDSFKKEFPTDYISDTAATKLIFSTFSGLLFEGDNLVVLQSLRSHFSDQVQLIYIDPPYNTSSRSFQYDDAMEKNHWLTFMKNRLEVSREFLTKDGFLFLHISFHRFNEVKSLLDEIYGNENYVGTIHLVVRHPRRILKGDRFLHDIVEYILIYARDKKKGRLAKIPKQHSDEKYKYRVEEISCGKEIEFGGKKCTILLPDEYRIVKSESDGKKLQKISIRGSLKEANSSGRFYQKYLLPLIKKYPSNTVIKVPGIGDDGMGFRYFYLPPEGNVNGGYYQGPPLTNKRSETPYPNLLDMVEDFNGVGYEGGVSYRNGKKPEKLLEFVFTIAGLRAGDLVMDFFLGSGTTAVCAMKKKLRWIGMDLDTKTTIERIRKLPKDISERVSQFKLKV